MAEAASSFKIWERDSLSSTFFAPLSEEHMFLEGGDGLKVTVLFQIVHCFVGPLYLNIFLVAAFSAIPFVHNAPRWGLWRRRRLRGRGSGRGPQEPEEDVPAGGDTGKLYNCF